MESLHYHAYCYEGPSRKPPRPLTDINIIATQSEDNQKCLAK